MNASGLTLTTLRNEILKTSPDLQLHKKFPAQLIWFFIFTGGIVGLSLFSISQYREHGFNPVLILLSLAIGALYGSLGLFTHELLHGSIIKNKAVSDILAWFGFFIFGLSPEVWSTWHNRVHHYHTNQSGRDPDSFGLWDDFKDYPMNDFILKRAPGSGHWLSWLYLPINFSNQAITVTWYFLWKGDAKLYGTIHKTRAMVETLLSYAIWVFCFMHFGWQLGLILLLVPALVANLIASSYILVQHLFCPLTEQNLPLENTLGVKTHPWLDRIHFNFSHHVEHHIFPELNHSFYPKVRAHVEKTYPKDYRVMGHAKALHTLLTSPRVYQDPNTLWNPHSKASVDIRKIGRKN